jgi:hypothetical protein
MYKTFICKVSFISDRKSMTFGVSAGNQHEVREAMSRYLTGQDIEEFSIIEVRDSTPSEGASLNLPAGDVKLLN